MTMAKRLKNGVAAFFAIIALTGLSPVPEAAAVPERVDESGCGGAAGECDMYNPWWICMPSREIGKCEAGICTVKES